MKSFFTFIFVSVLCALSTLVPVFYLAITNPQRSKVTLKWLNTDALMYRPDAELGSRLGANLDVVVPGPIGPYRVVTGQKGQRIEIEDNGKTNADRPTILYVGGSQSFGSGVTAGESTAGVLQRNSRFRVENFSVPGYGGVPSLMMAERHMDMAPSFIIYGLWEDHLRRNVARCAAIDSPVCFSFPRLAAKDDTWVPIMPPKPEITMNLVRAYYHDTAADRESYSLLTDFKWTAYTLFKQFSDVFLDDTREISRTSQIDAMKWMLKRTATLAREHNAELIVLYIPLYFSKINPMPSGLSDWMNQMGIRYVDLTEALRSMKKNNVNFMIEGDGHLNAAGHRLAAEALLTLLNTGRQ